MKNVMKRVTLYAIYIPFSVQIKCLPHIPIKLHYIIKLCCRMKQYYQEIKSHSLQAHLLIYQLHFILTALLHIA